MRKFSLTTSLLSALVLALGFGLVWGFLATSLVEWLLPSPANNVSFVVLQDGTPLMQRFDTGNQSVYYTDLRGQPVEVDWQDATLPWVELQASGHDYGPRARWSQRVRQFSDRRNRPTQWYFMSDGQRHGRAYFVGYDAVSKYRVGYMGKNGFAENQPAAEDCFPFTTGMSAISYHVISYQTSGSLRVPGVNAYTTSHGGESDFKDWQIFVLGDDQRIYEVDLRQRTVKLAFAAPHLQSCNLYTKNSKSPTYLVVRTDRQILLLNRQFKVERTYEIPEELANRSFFRWAEVAPNQALAAWFKYEESISSQGAEEITWFDQAGHVTRQETAPPRSTAWFNTSLALACPIVSLLVIGIFWIFPHELLDRGVTDSLSIAERIALQGTWPAILFVTLFCTLLAVLCYRRQVRYAAPNIERIVWPIFVFLGGLPVWVAYRFGRHWPVLERCPDCGAEVPRDHETCAACRQEFPLPEHHGFEILTA